MTSLEVCFLMTFSLKTTNVDLISDPIQIQS